MSEQSRTTNTASVLKTRWLWPALSVVLAALLAGCSSPVLSAASSQGAVQLGPSFPVEVTWGSLSGDRGLGDDSAVNAVAIRVWNGSGQLIGEGTLSKSTGSWRGSITVSQTGPANFKAYAKDVDGHLLYLGVQLATLSGTGDSVAIYVDSAPALTYDGNGETSGEVPEDSSSYSENDPITVAGSGTLTKTGYSFAGWTTNCAGAGATYAASYHFSKPSGNVILYAVWIPNSLKFTSSGNSIVITGHNTAPSGPLTIPTGVTAIQTYAFFSVSGLTELVLPESLLSIGQGAFMGCSNLTTVTLPDSLIEIGGAAFWSCRSLKTVAIPRNVTTIGGEALGNCASLTTLTVDEDNPYYQSAGGAIYNKTGTTLVQVANGLEGSFDVPDGVTKIGFGALMGCEKLTAITLPSTLTELEAEAFRQCVSLTAIELPEGITTIPEAAFYDCIAMTSFTIPDSVTTIENNALQDCRSLTSLTIPATVTSIGNYVLDSCSALVSLQVDGANPNYQSEGTELLSKDGETLVFVLNGLAGEYAVPDGVTTVSDAAFSNCRLLTGVSIPESVTSIGDWAFASCLVLEEVTLPSGLTALGIYAFYGCTDLVAVYANSVAPPTLADSSGAFENCSAELQILVPSSSLNAYQTASGWSDYSSLIAEQEPA